jgi:Cyclic nucleotide-binding domain/FHA domain
MQAYEVLSGDMIFREGDAGEYACIIRSGRVQILKHTPHGEVELAVLSAGDVFGEMALFEPADQRSATARALDHVVVDVLSANEMKELIAQCPPVLQPFMSALVSRLREMNRRLAEKARATVLLEHAINTLRISAEGEMMQALMRTQEIKLANLPFSIGGYEHGKAAPQRHNLEIACASVPMNISYDHCAIEHHDDGIYIVDQGSRFRTIVNGKSIGRGEATAKALLLPGNNSVTLGNPAHDMHLVIFCE